MHINEGTVKNVGRSGRGLFILYRKFVERTSKNQ